MRAFPSPSFFVLAATFLCACSEPERVIPERESPAPAGDPQAIDGAQEAIDSGRAEIFHFEHVAERRNSTGTMRVLRSVTFPQFAGDEPGLKRINGFLRHLAFEWPALPWIGQSSPAESAKQMSEVGQMAATLEPGDWPSLAQVESMAKAESMNGPFPAEFLATELYPSQDEASFGIHILRMDSGTLTLHLEIFDASGVRPSYNEGELTLDLRTGEAIEP